MGRSSKNGGFGGEIVKQMQVLVVESPVNGGFRHLSERTPEAMLCRNVFRPTNEGTYHIVNCLVNNHHISIS
jgi:hypothetical protein